jgi:hypothetical protein
VGTGLQLVDSCCLDELLSDQTYRGVRYAHSFAQPALVPISDHNLTKLGHVLCAQSVHLEYLIKSEADREGGRTPQQEGGLPGHPLSLHSGLRVQTIPI